MDAVAGAAADGGGTGSGGTITGLEYRNGSVSSGVFSPGGWFSATANVNRIRLFKDNDSGGVGPVAKNLTIEDATSAAATPLAARF